MSGDSLDQSEIERLLSGIGGGASSSEESASASAPADDSGVLSQDELNALFGAAPAPAAPSAPPASPPSPKPPPPPAASAAFTPGWDIPTVPVESASSDDEEEEIPRGDLDYLAKKAEDSLRSIAATPTNLPAEVIEFQFPEFGGTVPSTEHATLDLISEVDLDVKVELGRTYMYIEDVLRLRRGSVVPLDKMAGETVDIFINGRLLARGEVLVMNENFCVRIAELLAGAIPME
ncbi:MAG: flagellar motor switch protein FliN [Planctomycetaceae bacterium]|nr:flagellar motor switch protein FliN [Planctomycetaceae bacterium]